MGSEKPLLSQKEYLKRYLSKDKNKKKRKKTKISSSSHIKRSVIIDDDLGLKDVASVDDEEFNLDYLGDDAPQIAGIVDERPTELKAKEKYSNTLWSTVGDRNNDEDSVHHTRNDSALDKMRYPSNHSHNSESDSDLSLPRLEKKDGKNVKKSRDKNHKNLQKERQNTDSDLSPERKRGKDESRYDSDMSPPRSSKSRNKYKESEAHEWKKINSYDTKKDSMNIKKSRTQHIHEDSDSETLSKEYKSGNVHRRYKEKQFQKKHKEGKSRYNSGFDDESRNSYRYQNSEKHGRYGGKTSSTSRKYGEPELKEISSAKLRRTENKEDRDSDLSPPRNHSQSQKKKDKLNSRLPVEERMLEGKKSGLQDAKHLKEELKRLKENENKIFKKMDPSMLGAMAAPVQRDRKTGQVRRIEQEKEEEKAKAEKRAKTENKYYKWGKGLKQMQDKEDRIADALHEMSKPLARYRDDKDLDAFLRAQEREGDPMLEYIRNKQAESHNVVDLTVGTSKPKYRGSFMPNRFGIEPGYRWDGVDRSNGYEKKWFEQRNARKAIEEQAYKWSTSDM